jgi:UDP-glucose-4-epimerase GalE
MKVLVTGGAGYIGSHAVRALHKKGHNVVIYDNLSTGHESLAAGFELVRGEIGDANALRPALAGIDAVMHFAAHAYVGESVENPRKYFANNVSAGLALLDTALTAGVKKVVFSSTCAVYGIPERVPIPETAPRDPVNPYGVSKLFFEKALDAYAMAYGLRFVCLRYFNAAGADESGQIGECHEPETHLIPLALRAAAGEGPPLAIYGDDYPTPDGTCIRDYIHVSDLANAHVRALEYVDNGGGTTAFNLGVGRGYSVNEVLAAIEEVTGHRVPSRPAPRRPGDPPALIADARLAQKELGWQAEYSLREIVSTAWTWMQRMTLSTAKTI